MISHWKNNGWYMKIVVIWYTIWDSLTANFLTPQIIKTCVALCHCGLIVNNVTTDSATNNRSYFTNLDTISIQENFDKSRVQLTVNQNKCLSLEKMIHFKHLIQGNIIVFIRGEMPHLVNKFVNAFESSGLKKGKRNLMFPGKSTSLTMLQDIYEHV